MCTPVPTTYPCFFSAVIETSFTDVPMEKIMGLGAFDLKRVLDKEPDFLDVDAKHEHDKTVNSFCFQDPAPLVLHLLERWIGGLIRAFIELRSSTPS
jgi:G3E family GTPase